MRTEWLERFRIETALVALATLGLVLAAEPFEHTDDGCAVEIHCVVCLWQRGATVVPTAVAPQAVAVDVGRAPVTAVITPRLDGVSADTPSRAPPLA